MRGVRNVRGESEEQAEHQECALVGAFLVFDGRGAEEDIEHVEHAPKGVLDVLDMRGG